MQSETLLNFIEVCIINLLLFCCFNDQCYIKFNLMKPFILKFQAYQLLFAPHLFLYCSLKYSKRIEKALRIRMLIHILLGFKIVSFWEALINSLYLLNKVKLLNKEKVSFAL